MSTYQVHIILIEVSEDGTTDILEEDDIAQGDYDNFDEAELVYEHTQDLMTH